MEDNFEKILSDQFDKHTEKVDDKLLWESIMDKMEPEPKRRAIVLWTWTGLGLVSMIILVAIIYQLSPDVKTQELIEKSRNQISKNTVAINTSIPSNVVNENDTDPDPSNEALQSSDSTQQSQKGKTVTAINSYQTLNTKLSIIATQETPIIAQEKDQIHASKPQGKNGQSFQAEPKNTTKRIFTQAEVKSESGIDERLVKKAIDDLSNTIGDTETTKSMTRSIKVLALPFNIENQTNWTFKIPMEQISVNPVYSKVYKLFTSIGFHSSIDFGSSSLKSSSLSQEYLNNISEKMDLMEKIGLGVDINLIKFNNWSFSSGVGAEYLTDRFSWTGRYIDYREGEYIESITKLVDGTTRDNKLFGEIPWEVQKKINYYDDRLLISVPLMVSYELRKGNSRFGASTGVDLRFQGSHTSLVLNENKEPEYFNIKSSILSPSIRLSLGYGYYLNDKWSLGVEMNASQIKSHFAIDPTTSNLYYRMLGIRFGIRYEGL